MELGCAETREPEAGVRMPRSELAFRSPEGVSVEAKEIVDGQPGRLRLGRGETPYLHHPLPMGKPGVISRLV